MQWSLKVLCEICTLNLHKADADNNDISATGHSFCLSHILALGIIWKQSL